VVSELLLRCANDEDAHSMMRKVVRVVSWWARSLTVAQGIIKTLIALLTDGGEDVAADVLRLLLVLLRSPACQVRWHSAVAP